MANRIRTLSERSNASNLCCLTGHAEMEYFWCVELSASKKCVRWIIESDDTEDTDDEDYINHNLIVKMAVLDANAVPGEQNVITLESDGQEGELHKGAIVNLTRGLNPMAVLNFTLQGKIGGTFTLIEGSGPVTLSGNHLLEFPSNENENQMDVSQSTSDLADENDDENDDEENNEEEDDDFEKKGKRKKSIKRKASLKSSRQKKVKREEDDSDSEEEEEDDDDDFEQVKTKHDKKVKDTSKKGKTKIKTEKDSGKKLTKKMK